MNNDLASKEMNSFYGDGHSVPRNKHYDAASQETVTVTTDRLRIWLDDCQGELLKEKCAFFNSISNFIAVLGILITLIATLIVTEFPSALWEAIYIVMTVIAFLALLYIGYNCLISHRRKRSETVSDCIIRKIRENSKISVSNDG